MAVICENVEKSSKKTSGLWDGKKAVSHTVLSSVSARKPVGKKALSNGLFSFYLTGF